MDDPNKPLFRYTPGHSILSARPLTGAAWAIAALLLLGPIVAMFVAGALTPGQGAGWPLLTIVVTGTVAWMIAKQILKTRSAPAR